MILSVFITVISGHDKPQPPGCLLGNSRSLWGNSVRFIRSDQSLNIPNHQPD
ncbi:nuclease, partial [Escherichia coli]|nr:nuclease [Escherichia coli]